MRTIHSNKLYLCNTDLNIFELWRDSRGCVRWIPASMCSYNPTVLCHCRPSAYWHDGCNEYSRIRTCAPISPFQRCHLPYRFNIYQHMDFSASATHAEEDCRPAPIIASCSCTSSSSDRPTEHRGCSQSTHPPWHCQTSPRNHQLYLPSQWRLVKKQSSNLVQSDER